MSFNLRACVSPAWMLIARLHLLEKAVEGVKRASTNRGSRWLQRPRLSHEDSAHALVARTRRAGLAPIARSYDIALPTPERSHVRMQSAARASSRSLKCRGQTAHCNRGTCIVVYRENDRSFSSY
ncbi:MAG: hypothetical protein AAB421_01060 [Patescibacteria group bacterium]